jgi:hypothetical protein
LKVAFDENIPPAMARVFQILATEKQFQWLIAGLVIERAKDYTPKKGDPDYLKNDDVPWIKRFSAAGGKIIISGNTKMKTRPHERMALVQEGMVTIFFESQWSNWKFHRKCALLLHWWPHVVKTVKTAKPGTFWHVPCDWKEDGKLRAVSNEDGKLTKIQRQIAARDYVRKRRRAGALAAAQGKLDFEGQNQ